MAPRGAQFEALIEPYRRERRLLVAKNIYFLATRAEFETAVRTKLTMGDSVRFVWRQFRRNKKRHRGYTFIVFNTREDSQRAINELRPFEFCGRRVKIEIASREAFVSGSEYAQATSAPAAAAAAPPPPPPPPPAAAAVAEIEHDQTEWATHEFEERFTEYGSESPEVEYDSA